MNETQFDKLLAILKDMKIKYLQISYNPDKTKTIWWDVGCGDNLIFNFKEDGSFIKEELYGV